MQKSHVSAEKKLTQTDGPTHQPTIRPTQRVIESRSARLRNKNKTDKNFGVTIHRCGGPGGQREGAESATRACRRTDVWSNGRTRPLRQEYEHVSFNMHLHSILPFSLSSSSSSSFPFAQRSPKQTRDLSTFVIIFCHLLCHSLLSSFVGPLNSQL